ncbi:MAG: hypothetical protein DIZ80_00615 [endosymbiont of Galathealinum brachiosum]|uniref:Uncharacterized protein n=1 Tax=endosymbiont of Galathealinum brachiosum TaxID=2200906 RepID=A0A370DM79_9GAMM|nr:MAG: hypothetical protein DIZ80_00615 [endosymbiont of Galathealinum brachiosum]
MTPLGPMMAIQTLYTSSTNKSGMFVGGPAPSGKVNLKKNTITVDMSGFFAKHGPMVQNLGGIAEGTYDPGTGGYSMSWSAVLTQGSPTLSNMPVTFRTVTFTFTGVAELADEKLDD